MKALVAKSYGKPNEVLELQEVEIPKILKDEILVEVHYSSVNRTDTGILSGKPGIVKLFYGFPNPKVKIRGCDFAGFVHSVGSEVKDYKVGDRVWGFDDNTASSHAHFVKVKNSKNIALLPDNVSFEDAMACIEGGHYAINFLNKVGIKAGDKVLVYGASGAIGINTVQLAMLQGAVVTAVGNAAIQETLLSVGVQKAMDYTKEDFMQLGEQYDFIFDAVGKSSFGICKKLLKPKGIYISSELGDYAQNVWYSLLTPILGGKKVVFPIPSNVHESLKKLGKYLAEKKMIAVTDKIYDFDNIIDAYKYVIKGQKTGAVLVKMN